MSTAFSLYSLKFSIMSSSLLLMDLVFSVPRLMFFTCSLTFWLHVFIWRIFLNLTPYCWIHDDFLFLIVGLFLYIFSIWMFAIDPGGSFSRFLCLVCCLICTNCSLVYVNRLFVGWLCMWFTLFILGLFSVGIIWIRLEKLITVSNIVMSNYRFRWCK